MNVVRRYQYRSTLNAFRGGTINGQPAQAYLRALSIWGTTQLHGPIRAAGHSQTDFARQSSGIWPDRLPRDRAEALLLIASARLDHETTALVQARLDAVRRTRPYPNTLD